MPPVLLSLDAMATRFELALHGLDPPQLRAAGEEALAEIARLERVLSFYRADSEITDVNEHAARAPVRVSAEVFRLLATCVNLSIATSGAFDVTVGPLMRAWQLTDGGGAVPDRFALDAARAATGSAHVVLDPAEGTVRFARPGMAIDLGAVGRGHAIDVAIERLREAGVTSALLHGGTSSVHAMGVPPDEAGWKIVAPSGSPAAPASSRQVIRLRDEALSVSVPDARSFVQDGRVYGHVMDPRTGEPVTDGRTACVTGPASLLCDALSTALLVHGKTWLPELQDRWPGYQGWIA